MTKLDEIRDRWKKATPGPWVWVDDRPGDAESDRRCQVLASGRKRVLFAASWWDCAYDVLESVEAFGQADADAIAHAPVDVEILLAEVDILREELAEHKGRVCVACRHARPFSELHVRCNGNFPMRGSVFSKTWTCGDFEAKEDGR